MKIFAKFSSFRAIRFSDIYFDTKHQLNTKIVKYFWSNFSLAHFPLAVEDLVNLMQVRHFALKLKVPVEN